MDFQTLTRRELQSLCKLNKIPANLTNVAMAEALKSLQTVVGIEEYLNVTHSETADVVQSVEVVLPKASQTRCRTSTRQKVKPIETETLQSTVTRTTRRGSKQPPKEVEESKNDSLKTPAVSRTTRRNVSNRLSECESEVKEENKCSTRRLTRLTEKKSAAPTEKKAVKIDSTLDQGKSNGIVEDICNAFDVVTIEEEVSSNLKQEAFEESMKISSDDKSVEEVEVKSIIKQDVEDDLKKSEEKDDEMKPESDEVCDEVSNIGDDLNKSEEKDNEETHFEKENLVQKLEVGDGLISEHNPVVIQEEEHCDENGALNPCEDESSGFEENDAVVVQAEITDASLESVSAVVDAGFEIECPPCADSEMFNGVAETKNSSMVASSMIIDNTENPIDEIITKEMEEMSVDETTAMTEEVEDLKPELFIENNMNEKSEADSGPIESPLLPIKKATPFKSMTEEVEYQKFEVFTENNDKFDAESGLAQDQVTGAKNASDDKENNVIEVKNIKKDENDKIKSANDMSIRQLKKLLKAMTLNTHNSEEEGESVATKRTALQAVCENQMMVGGENEN